MVFEGSSKEVKSLVSVRVLSVFRLDIRRIRKLGVIPCLRLDALLLVNIFRISIRRNAFAFAGLFLASLAKKG